jgi:hypothetical protein
VHYLSSHIKVASVVRKTGPKIFSLYNEEDVCTSYEFNSFSIKNIHKKGDPYFFGTETCEG